jgi:hypothetical protein
MVRGSPCKNIKRQWLGGIESVLTSRIGTKWYYMDWTTMSCMSTDFGWGQVLYSAALSCSITRIRKFCTTLFAKLTSNPKPIHCAKVKPDFLIATPSFPIQTGQIFIDAYTSSAEEQEQEGLARARNYVNTSWIQTDGSTGFNESVGVSLFEWQVSHA